MDMRHCHIGCNPAFAKAVDPAVAEVGHNPAVTTCDHRERLVDAEGAVPTAVVEAGLEAARSTADVEEGILVRSCLDCTKWHVAGTVLHFGKNHASVAAAGSRWSVAAESPGRATCTVAVPVAVPVAPL
jgi:hypothetical protein